MKSLYILLLILITSDFSYTQKAFKIDINRLKITLDNQGVFADVRIDDFEGGWYDEGTVIFSGGFFLSGKSDDTLWANAIASASRIQDYLPGIVGSSQNDSLNRLYIVKAIDPPFGESWQNWSDAVSIGADFYDGNGDGIYNPVDLNGNGIWDLNEDKPDILGDITIWCVYNDGVPSNLRRFNQVLPQGIEIHQTVFAVGNNITGPAESMIFIRYRFVNKSTAVDVMDSVYFSLWTDADIGDEYFDDLTGSDTTINSGYTYNSGNDGMYGVNPPAVFLTLLQGPVVYIPGETFIDNNNNGIYDPEIDTPLDTAFVNNGLFIGSEVFPGAKNLDMSSFVHYMSSNVIQGDPNTHNEARNYMEGKNRIGNFLDPCTWTFGQVTSIPCDLINPLFIYSGDPVTSYGWINNFPTDQRMMVNTGPFELKVNEPVDIWIGYVVGRGTDALNSITIGRNHVEYAHQYYKSNFSFLPVDVYDDFISLNEYHLYQNYPNPFNPVTTIKYQIPVTGKVTLKVFDILGREIATLVNEEKPAGSYEVHFDASFLSSGIYFYEMRTKKFSSVKKMILLR